MKTKHSLLLIFAILPVIASFGQVYENTKPYDEKKGSPNASLEDIYWIQGLWRGESFGGITEEVWTPRLEIQ